MNPSNEFSDPTGSPAHLRAHEAALLYRVMRMHDAIGIPEYAWLRRWKASGQRSTDTGTLRPVQTDTFVAGISKYRPHGRGEHCEHSPARHNQPGHDARYCASIRLAFAIIPPYSAPPLVRHAVFSDPRATARSALRNAPWSGQAHDWLQEPERTCLRFHAHQARTPTKHWN